MTVEDAVGRFLADKGGAGLRPRSLGQMRFLLGRLVAGLGGRAVSSIGAGDLVGLLSDLRPAPVARNNFRRCWASFFRWAEASGFCVGNPALAVSRAIEERKAPGVLTVDEAGRLLAAAVRDRSGVRDLVPFLALGLFAGLRTDEICRLDWSAVDLGAGLVRVGSAVEKTRVGRLVPIVAPLGAWLRLCSRRRGRVVGCSESTRARALASLRVVAGLVGGWPANALRHSFASYRLAVLGDAGRVATELGHTSTEMLFRHYRALVTPAAGRRFFALSPAAVRRFRGVLLPAEGLSCRVLAGTSRAARAAVSAETAGK